MNPSDTPAQTPRASTDLESISAQFIRGSLQSEPKILSGNEVFRVAAVYIMDAAHRRYFDHKSDTLSLKYYDTFCNTWFRFLLKVAVFVHLALIAFEPPSAVYVNPIFLALVEFCCLGCYSYELVLISEFTSAKRFYGRPKHMVQMFLIIANGLDILASLAAGSDFRFTKLFRVYFLCYQNKFLRMALINVFKQTIPRVMDIVFVEALLVTAYAVCAYLLFGRSEIDTKRFGTLGDSFLNFFILLTTANFPDVMMDCYRNNAFSSLFFISYLVTALWFLMNLVLAVVSNRYRESLKEEIAKEITRQRELLGKSFMTLDTENKGFIQFEAFCDLMSYIKPEYDRDALELSFSHLDVKKNNVLDLEEFQQMRAFVLTQIREEKPAWAIEKCFPKIPHHLDIVAKIRSGIYSDAAGLCLDLVLIAFGIWTILAGDWDDEGDMPIIKAVTLTGAILFNVECVLKLCVLGPQRFFRENVYRFDFMVSVAIFITNIWVFSNGKDGLQENLHVLQTVVNVRSFRIFRYATASKRLRVVIRTVLEAMPAFARFGGLVFVLYYVFASVGMWLFAGLITPGEYNPLLEGTDFLNSNYYENNFNNFLRACVTLFELQIVNNWYVTALGYVAVTSPLHIAFFIGYYFFAVVITLNLFVAFVLQAFLHVLQAEKASNISKTTQNVPSIGAGVAGWATPRSKFYLKKNNKTYEVELQVGVTELLEEIFKDEIGEAELHEAERRLNERRTREDQRDFSAVLPKNWRRRFKSSSTAEETSGTGVAGIELESRGPVRALNFSGMP